MTSSTPDQNLSDAVTQAIRGRQRERAAVLPILVTEIKAEALREAARAAVTDGNDMVPWDHDHDRATVAAWLNDRADHITAQQDEANR